MIAWDVLIQLRQRYTHLRYRDRLSQQYEPCRYTGTASQYCDHVISVDKFWRILWPSYVCWSRLDNVMTMKDGGTARKLYDRVRYTGRASQWNDHVVSVVKFWWMVWPYYICWCSLWYDGMTMSDMLVKLKHCLLLNRIWIQSWRWHTPQKYLHAWK